MPELPEVETIRRSLLPFVKGKIIKELILDTPSVFTDPDPFSVEGMTVTKISRRGKYLLLRLAGKDKEDQWLLVHLRMTGRLTLQPEKDPVAKHTHVRFGLGSPGGDLEIWLIFQDTRRFGRIWLEPAGPAGTFPKSLDKLGPEPFARELNAQVLARQLKRHPRLALKAALLDQSVLAGIGNIYADEILFATRLAPQRPAGTLEEAELERLAEVIPLIINRAIELCGTTLRDYVDGWNQSGSFQDFLMAYGRAGQDCKVCGQIMQKTKLAGRTTSWCPTCQSG